MPASHRKKKIGNTSMPEPEPLAHASYLIWFSSKTALVYPLIVLAELIQLSSQRDH